jgi:hypothetical protein
MKETIDPAMGKPDPPTLVPVAPPAGSPVTTPSLPTGALGREMESPHLKEMADQGVGKPDLVSPASVAPPVSSPTTTSRVPMEAPWERGREEDNPVAVVLAIHRTSGVELRRGPGRGGT